MSDTTNDDLLSHDDYEAAFQAAEHTAQTRLRTGVAKVPIAAPHTEGWHTWAFRPLDMAGAHPVERIEVQMEAEGADGRIPVHLTRGDPSDPEILETHEVGA